MLKKKLDLHKVEKNPIERLAVIETINYNANNIVYTLRHPKSRVTVLK